MEKICGYCKHFYGGVCTNEELNKMIDFSNEDVNVKYVEDGYLSQFFEERKDLNDLPDKTKEIIEDIIYNIPVDVKCEFKPDSYFSCKFWE